MSGCHHPTVKAELRNLYVSEEQYWQIANSESTRIRVVTDKPFILGQQLRICMNAYKSPDQYGNAIFRYVVGVFSAIPLYLDEDSVVLELCPFNSASL